MSQEIIQPDSSESTDTIALIIEIVFGLFGILGVGWLYAGNFVAALLVFVGFMVLVAIEAFLAFVTFGLAACFIAPLNIAVAIISGLRVRDYVRETGAKGAFGNLLFVLVAIGVIAAIIIGLALVLAFIPSFR